MINVTRSACHIDASADEVLTFPRTRMDLVFAFPLQSFDGFALVVGHIRKSIWVGNGAVMIAAVAG